MAGTEAGRYGCGNPARSLAGGAAQCVLEVADGLGAVAAFAGGAEAGWEVLDLGGDFHRDEDGAAFVEDLADADGEIFQVVEVVGRNVAGALRQGGVVDGAGVGDGLAAGGG